MSEVLNAAKNILVVDDNPIHRGLVEHKLKNRYALTLAADHETAASRVADRGADAFCLLILDSSIPHSEGGEPQREESLSFLTAFRRVSESPVILVVSGPMSDRLRANYSKHGVVAVFEKPFSLVELVSNCTSQRISV